MKNTIVYFHTGRGGRFYNGGHTTFCGCKNIYEVLQMNDSGKNTSFLIYENEYEIRRKIKEKENLFDLFDRCKDKGDFT